MSATLDFTLCGETLRLDAERALFWPARRLLLLADLHLGKAAVFRRAGIGIPRGASQHDLDRLAALIERHRPQQVRVLGDLVHGAVSAAESWIEPLQSLAARPGLDFAVIGGNHDRRPGPLAGLRWLPDQIEPPFVLGHEPGADPRGYRLGGHLHPVLRLRSAADQLRLPVLWVRPDHAVLPAFGSFTGGAAVSPERADRVYACSGGEVVELPVQAAPMRRPRQRARD